MNMNQYQIFASRTMPEMDDKGKANYALGLTGEAGECGDIVKKEVFHGHAADVDAIKKELGDVLHYVAGLALMYGIELEDVATANVEKLRKRYPSGFNTADSIARRDTK
ncbi:nucleoside triphosphate pyrophosphohydrolase family protein [Bhargavaea ginsengi]|uniref:nucleoside triphosphate pyrophosphohydrolase family protein n=1 Tax=Bhargavaea ginsengi TaxID=426757 RepID=UPI003C791C2F